MKWRRFVFTLRGADRATHGVKYGDEGYLHLCYKLNNNEYLGDYEILDRDFRPGDGGRNVATDWTGFHEALRKHEGKHLTPPSVFSGRYQHCKEGHELRQWMLHAICREYQHPEALVDDLWAFLTRGKPEEAAILIRLLVLYWERPDQRPEGRTIVSARQ